MKKIALLLWLLCFFLSKNVAQSSSITLSGTSYTETFDGISSGLPTGWAIKTGATSTTTEGTDATFTSTATTWSSTTGNFRNVASADGLLGNASTTTQNSSTDRALAVRQTGSFGDPGAAFVVRIANTMGFNSFQMSFKLQSLDETSSRTVNWIVEYAIGSSPLTFTAITTSPSLLPTGNTQFTNTSVTVNFAALLNNQASNVWIRIRTAGGSTGSGNRPTTGIDDFNLTYSATTSTPNIAVSTASLPNFTTTEGSPSTTQNYTVSGSNLTDNIVITAPTGFEISTNSASGFTSSITLTQTGGNVALTTIFARLIGTTQGSFNGNITHTSTNATTRNVAVTGTVNAPVTIITIAAAKASAVGTIVTVQGRLTVSSQFGGQVIYIQDSTAGTAVFSSNAAIYPTTWQLGDLVQVTGPIGTFNSNKQISAPTSVFVVSGQTNQPVTPLVITPDQMLANEGRLVRLNNFNFVSSGTFVNNTNYNIADCNNVFSVVRARGASANTIIGTAIPTTTRDIIGIADAFNGAPQLEPRFLADIATVAGQQCAVTTTCNPTAVVTPDNSIDRDLTLDVATWNVEWLGNPDNNFGPNDEQLQQNNVKCVIEKLKSDIIVFQEVCDVSLLPALLPAGFGYKCSTDFYSHFFDNPDTDGNTAQKVCVAYRTANITPIEAECKAILDNYATFAVGSPNSNFWASGRLPYMFTANANIDGIIQKIRVIGIHAKSGSAIADYNRRKFDVEQLKIELDAQYSKDAVIVAGDFNDDVDVSITSGQPSSYSAYLNDNLNYRVVTKVLSDAGRKSTVSFNDMIDHIMVTNELFNAYETGTAYVSTATDMSFIGSYGTTTSDHYPVFARFSLKKAGPRLAVKTLLEGSFNGSVMSEQLRQSSLLPLNQPYNSPEYTHTGNGGIEKSTATFFNNNNIVDWVVIELRDKNNPATVLYSQSALVQNDGDVYDENGNNFLIFETAPFDNYYVAVRHRNHLRVMTATALPFNNSTLVNVDFTEATTATYGANGRKLVGSKYCMYAGDINQDSVIDASDRSEVWNQRNASGYIKTDCSLDGLNDASDRSQTWNNRNISNQF